MYIIHMYYVYKHVYVYIISAVWLLRGCRSSAPILSSFYRTHPPTKQNNVKRQDEILDVISTSRQAGLMVLQHICKYFVERAHYMVKVCGCVFVCLCVCT